MSNGMQTKWVREGAYAAEVDVEVTHEADPWEDTISLADATKLDLVRKALRRGDVRTAQRSARVYRLTPIAAG